MTQHTSRAPRTQSFASTVKIHIEFEVTYYSTSTDEEVEITQERLDEGLCGLIYSRVLDEREYGGGTYFLVHHTAKAHGLIGVYVQDADEYTDMIGQLCNSGLSIIGDIKWRKMAEMS
jgi:hypothetical protein